MAVEDWVRLVLVNLARVASEFQLFDPNILAVVANLERAAEEMPVKCGEALLPYLLSKAANLLALEAV